MWKSGTWPGGVATESSSNMDSAGSCDSVISVNSVYSDDSMEHLSAEERACLMYLEETIEALEVQEDSGLSNDEPEAYSKAERSASEQQEGNGMLSTKSEDSVGQTDFSAAESSPNSLVSDSCPGLSAEASEIDLGIIPPPSDFMDDADSSSCAEKAENVPPPTESQSSNQTSESSHLSRIPPLVMIPNIHMSSPSKVPEPKSPPAVAPKPKKLPPNIVLKAHKTSVAALDGNGSNKVLIDPQRVRMEALRKLGLLKSNDEAASPYMSPKLPPKTRMSWAAPSPPISPATADPPPIPDRSESPTSKTMSQIRVPDDLPVPAAFRDPVVLSPSNINTETSGENSPALDKQPTPAKFGGIRSASLNHHPHMGTEITRQNSLEVVKGNKNLCQLRNNRPRPSSLGSGKDFCHDNEAAFQAASAEPDSQKPSVDQSGFRFFGESPKLARSQGVSVHICPRSENGENRREALKKLGLLRD